MGKTLLQSLLLLQDCLAASTSTNSNNVPINYYKVTITGILESYFISMAFAEGNEDISKRIENNLIMQMNSILE